MRDLIDYAVAREVVTLLQERFNNQKEPLGKAVATAAIVITAMAMQEGNENDAKRLAAALRLIEDLAINGWEISAVVEQTQ